ncbi:MAG: 50S ribosomal protein L25 [Thermaceae bacterium]
MEYRLKVFYRESEKPSTLRRMGRLPGVMYNKSLNRKVWVDLKEFDRVFRQAGIHHVITLEFPDGRVLPSLVRQVNLDKRRRRPEHVDFYILSDEPVEMYIPLRFVGEAPGVREGGVLQEVHRDLLVRVLPRAIPEYIEVDVSGLYIGDSLHAEDLKLPEGVRLAMDPKETIVAVVPPEDVEKLAAEAEAAPAEPEVIKKGKKEEEA